VKDERKKKWGDFFKLLHIKLKLMDHKAFGVGEVQSKLLNKI